MLTTSWERSLRRWTGIEWPAAGLSLRALALSAPFMMSETTDTASKAMLDVASKLHRYSARNVILILSQRPEGVTRVCGYRRWQSLGRQVRKGEAGIAILAPCVYRTRPADEAAGRDAPEVVRILRGFRVAYVWDQLSRELSSLKDRFLSSRNRRFPSAFCGPGQRVESRRRRAKTALGQGGRARAVKAGRRPPAGEALTARSGPQENGDRSPTGLLACPPAGAAQGDACGPRSRTSAAGRASPG